MMSICFKEGIKMSRNALIEIIIGTGCDIRQTLNHLAMWSVADKNVSMETAQKEAQGSKKDTVLGPWEVIRKVFTKKEQESMSLADKSRLFFFDYSIGPLFVQENYLSVEPECKDNEKCKRAAQAADAISIGDLIDSKIRGTNNWSLLESQAIFSSVLPGHYMAGHFTDRINFPGWLGKNSSANKHKRILSELYMHTRMSSSGNRLAMNLDYLVPLRNAIINPLKKYGVDGVQQAIDIMKAYSLLREDLDNLMELTQWKGTENPFNKIDAKVKSAFTRAYNKQASALPFAPGTAVSKKRAAAIDAEGILNEEDLAALADEDDNEDEDATADAFIKVKAKDTKSKTQTNKAGTSKGKEPTTSKKKGRSAKK
ncbi:unnamed protein product [Acanthoscelides obtectus]|nr:unnamed protein product [Acanthoscelides obtectus]CAK1629725.1 Replication factor C subunit 1 [Acanthoscelides obtectus]